MKINQKPIDDLNALLEVTVTVDDYQPRVDKSLKNMRQKADMKGFRKGNVPMGLVKKMYGNQILLDEINQLMQDEINSYLTENDVQILGYPLPKDGQDIELDVNETKDYSFIYELGLTPAFELKHLDKAPKVEMMKIKVEDKMLDEEVNRLRKQLGETTNPDKVEDGDMMNITLQELDEEGNVKEDGVQNSTAIDTSMIKDKAIQKKFIGAEKGATVDADVLKMFDKDEHEVGHHILNATHEQMHSMGHNYRITIDNISRVAPAEMNEDFFKKMYPDGDVTDEKQLRAKIEESLREYFDGEAEKRMMHEFADELIEKTDITLPDDFLKRWIKASNEQPITMEQVEAEYPAFARNLKWSLIINKIGRENEIKVSEEEIREATKMMVAQQMRQYGLTNLGDNELNSFAERQLSDREHVNRTRDKVMEDKIFDYLKSKIKVKEKEISLEDYNKKED